MEARKAYRGVQMTQEQFERSLNFIFNDKDSAGIIYEVKLDNGRIIYVVPEEAYRKEQEQI
jgi:hypothetical protein